MDEIVDKKDKTGECFYHDENGQLCLAISYCDKDQVVSTIVVEINEEI